MYVCICNAFTENQAKSAVCGGASSTAKVFHHLGGRPQCGKCVNHVRDIVRESLAANSTDTAQKAG